MQLLERVREIRADEHVDDSQVAAARRVLLQEITRSVRKPARRRRAAWIGAGGLVTACVTGAIVAGSVLAPAAAAVFEKAAEIAVIGEAFDVPAGKYLKITSSVDGFAYWDIDMPDEMSHFNNGDPADAEAALQVRQTRELYVPADQSQDWVVAVAPDELVVTYGPDADQAAAEHVALFGSILAAPGGTYSAPGDSGQADQVYTLDGRESWEDEPTDPQELLASLRLSVGAEDAQSAESDSSIVETLTARLTDGAAPPERRAAWLRVLGLLPGSTVESVEGGVTTIRFTWSTEWWTAWTLIDIDTSRGLVLGMTSSPALTGGEPTLEGLPEWQSRQTYTYEVVDSAPLP
ncbi:hypothetical protein [Microbacterium gorillae]|uniref:hypothetical protein n=1 Tax=Microbacterium gorillae TaxID=1231063 RepID=UPI003D959DA0